jgi:transcriptional regulator with XRE-family HTH domain
VVKLPGLRRQRELAALTQDELAQRAGIHRVTLARLELGGEAEMRTVRKLAQALGVQPADLMQPEPER